MPHSSWRLAPEFDNKLVDLKIRRGEVAHFQATFHGVEDERDTPEVSQTEIIFSQ